MNFAQIKAIEAKNKQRILKVCPQADENSGIYIFSREENGFKYAYVGQAIHLLTRLASHLNGYQHIDLSIKKHGLYSADNPTGYRLNIFHRDIEELDEEERRYILEVADAGYQLRNKTAGGQDEGKFGIADNKPTKGYRDGLKQGYKNAQKEIAGLFEHQLSVVYDKDKKLAERAYNKFNDFIGGANGNQKTRNE